MEWIAERFTDWLASPFALVQGIVVTVLWLPLVWFHLDAHGFWFLFFATLVSFLTQFPLAYASRRSERHMLNVMRLLVALAEEARGTLDEIEKDLEDLEAASVPLPSAPAPDADTPS